jgi:hypothetical protein
MKRERIQPAVMNKYNEQHGDRRYAAAIVKDLVPLVGQVSPRFHAGHISFSLNLHSR